jgi:hypothetical protein
LLRQATVRTSSGRPSQLAPQIEQSYAGPA